MKYKGRRQSDNVVDIRNPVEGAKIILQDSGPVNEEADVNTGLNIQALVRSAVKGERAKREYKFHVPAENALQGQKEAIDKLNEQLQSQGADRVAVEMLLGPRWKD